MDLDLHVVDLAREMILAVLVVAGPIMLVGLCVGLDGTDDLQRYLEAPSHLALVEKWRPRAAGFRIFDVGSEVSGR